MIDQQALPGERRAISVNSAAWQARLPADAWPTGLPNGTLWRRDIFELADRWRDHDASSRQLLAGVLMWGFGPIGYGATRTVRILAEDPTGHKLDTNLATLRANTTTTDTGLKTAAGQAALRQAFAQFTRGSDTNIRYLGPAFFTKLLYFAGYQHGVGGVQPLILDKVVAGHLPNHAGSANRYAWGWRAETWMDYLRWAGHEAERNEFGGEPDQVEIALFAGTYRPATSQP